MSRTLAAAVVALSLVAGACSDGGSDTTSTYATDTTSPSEAVALDDTLPAPLGPSVLQATVDMHPTNVLLGTLHVTTDVPSVLEITLDDGERSQLLVTTSQSVTEHTIPLRGLLADRTQTISVVPVAEGTTKGEAADVQVTTEPLPFVLPELTVVTAVPGSMAPGLTMFDVVQTADATGVGERTEQPPGLLIAVDDRGEVVWYQTADRFIADARLLDDGNLIYDTQDTEAVLADLDGNVLRRWHTALYDGEVTDDAPVTEVQTDSLHHEITMLPNGHLLSLSTRLHTLETDTPQCGESADEFTGEYLLVSDLVVEIDADTGEVLKEFDLYDALDPASDPVRRDICGTAFQNDNVFPVPQYAEFGEVIDWTHANAVVLDEDRNAVLVSIRHLNTVVALRYEDDENGPAGEVLWELGEDGTVALDGDETSLQHAVEVMDDGTLMIYDNGNERPEPQQSRTVQFSVDDAADDPADWTASQVWEWRSTVDGAPAFSLAVGDADPLDNGNVLITNGFYLGGYGGLNAQIQEVTPVGTDEATVVFELRVGGPGAWFVYRSERIPSLYPNPV